MIKTALVAGGAALGVIVLYRQFVADSVPDKVLLEKPFPIFSDDVGLALSIAFIAPALAGLLRKAAP